MFPPLHDGFFIISNSSFCGANCPNKLCLVECFPDVCKFGEDCTNMRFQRKQYADVEVRDTGTGKGAMTI